MKLNCLASEYFPPEVLAEMKSISLQLEKAAIVYRVDLQNTLLKVRLSDKGDYTEKRNPRIIRGETGWEYSVKLTRPKDQKGWEKFLREYRLAVRKMFEKFFYYKFGLTYMARERMDLEVK